MTSPTSRARPQLAALVSTALVAAVCALGVPGAAAETGAPVAGCSPSEAPAGWTAVDLSTPADPVAATATVTVTIPGGVREVVFDACGAEGGGPVGAKPGAGGRTTATLDVESPVSFDVVVGARGGARDGVHAFGFGGAARGGDYQDDITSAWGGGGGSFVFQTGTLTPVVVAGGGGGVWYDEDCGGGHGGGAEGGSALPFVDSSDPGIGCSGDDTSVATGGTQTAGGAGGAAGDCSGSPCVGGPGRALFGGDGNAEYGAGGGGGGWFGGGGGGGYAGGGGSGYAVPAARDVASHTGVQRGDGHVRVLYRTPVAPTFTSAAVADEVLVGTPYSRTVTTSGVATPTVGIGSGALPAGVSLTDHGDGTATLAGTPSEVGVFGFELTAANGAPPAATQPGTLTVSAPPPPPPPPAPPVETPATPSPSASPTASPTSSATPSAPACVAPTMTLDKTTITATGSALATITGAPVGSTVQLWAYTRPATTYRLVREQVVTADSTTFRVVPPANTRLFAAVEGCPAQSPSEVLNVRTALTLAATRPATRTYVFSGRSLPARPGGLVVSLYRVTDDGRQVLAAQTRAGEDGRWELRRVFLGSGRFGFVVRTGQDLQNAPGSSNVRPTLVF